jgi:hypothetical protein
MNQQSKLDSILSQLADDSFLTEDRYSRDCCKYCLTEYGNYYFGCNKKSIQENHKPDCLYRLAVEVLGESEK